MLKLNSQAFDLPHISATKMDQHIFRYHDKMMWRLGLYGYTGQNIIKTEAEEFHDYFKYFSKAAIFIQKCQNIELVIKQYEDKKLIVKNHRNLKSEIKALKKSALDELKDGYKLFKSNANYNVLLGAFHKSIMVNSGNAKKFLETALELAPDHAAAHAEIANLLKESPRAMESIERLEIIKHFEYAKNNDPSNWNNILNYAGFLLASSDEDDCKEGKKLLCDCAEQVHESFQVMELYFYAYTHQIASSSSKEALQKIFTILKDGKLSLNFDLTWNVEKSKLKLHPELNLVSDLAKAITGKQSDISNAMENIQNVLKKNNWTI